MVSQQHVPICHGAMPRGNGSRWFLFDLQWCWGADWYCSEYWISLSKEHWKQSCVCCGDERSALSSSSNPVILRGLFIAAFEFSKQRLSNHHAGVSGKDRFRPLLRVLPRYWSAAGNLCWYKFYWYGIIDEEHSVLPWYRKHTITFHWNFRRLIFCNRIPIEE